ncbi:hypothetical protein ACPA9J_25440 [Pseudomonas aeruginosa]
MTVHVEPLALPGGSTDVLRLYARRNRHRAYPAPLSRLAHADPAHACSAA